MHNRSVPTVPSCGALSVLDSVPRSACFFRRSLLSPAHMVLSDPLALWLSLSLFLFSPTEMLQSREAFLNILLKISTRHHRGHPHPSSLLYYCFVAFISIWCMMIRFSKKTVRYRSSPDRPQASVNLPWAQPWLWALLFGASGSIRCFSRSCMWILYVARELGALHYCHPFWVQLLYPFTFFWNSFISIIRALQSMLKITELTLEIWELSTQ